MKKKLTINDFTPVIPWDQIVALMGKRELNKFVKWMQGQTVPSGGVYPWDLERYLKGLPNID